MNSQKNSENRTMLTDLYQLTMNAAYHSQGKNDRAVFDLFIRKLPKDWGFFVANGIEDAIDYITSLHFTEEDIDFLREQGLSNESFLQSLREFKFTGDVYAVREGTPVTANTPLLRVEAPRTEAQLPETALLNMINFQTLIASKAHRVVHSASPAQVVDFGLRRAQEMDAAMKGARAAYLAGAVATSNVLAGKKYGIPIVGTQAHSFVMSFKEELEAFRAYARTFPDKSLLLIDTYDTIQGARNAVIVGKELDAQGKRLVGVRLDSGDLAELSKEVRAILDESNQKHAKIFASNDLNEYKIDELKRNGARIDSYGVGTEMITAKPVSAISGVYKLVEDEEGAKIKLSAEKKSYPGRKQVYRIEENGKYVRDILALEGEQVSGTPLLEQVVKNGARVKPRRSLRETRDYCLEQISKMPADTKSTSAMQYEINTSNGLDNLINALTARYSAGVTA